MKFLSKYSKQRRRLLGLAWLMIIVSGLLAWDYTSLSYWFLKEERVIKVVETQANVSRSQKCVRAGKGICTQYRTLTNREYLVSSPSETFYISPKLYAELEAGRTYYVTLRGWPRSVSPRWITRIPGTLMDN